MNFLSESLTMGLLVSLIFGSLIFYVYSRITYVEKRIGLFEKMLLDIKISQDQAPLHILQHIPSATSFHEVATPDIESYSSFLEEVNNQISESKEVNIVVEDKQEKAEEFEPAIQPEIKIEESNSIQNETYTPSVNYESMTKEELVEVVKAKGIHLSGRIPGRDKLIQLIKKEESISRIGE